MKKNKMGAFPSLDKKSEFFNIYNLDNDAFKDKFGLKEWGLKEEEIISRKNDFGSNKIYNNSFNHWRKIFFSLFAPFNLLLWIIAIIQLVIYLTQGYEPIDMISFAIIIFMIFLSTSVDYFQDYKAYKMNKKLTQLIENHILVLRSKVDVFEDDSIKNLNSKLVLVEEGELTIGEVIYLSSGDKVPADARIVWSKNLTVDQSDFTGESEWIKKSISNKGNLNDNIFDLENIIYQNSKVTSGNCFAVVFGVGPKTYSNSMNENDEKNNVTEYELGLKKVTKVLLLTLVVIFPLVLLIMFLKNGLIVSSLVFAISLIVSITPESLPAIMTLNLYEGSKRLKNTKIVVKNNSTTQTLGAIDILCTDKTGTLTNSQIYLENYLNFDLQEDGDLLNLAFLNANFQSIISNEIDKTILRKNIYTPDDLKEMKLIDEIPFTHERRLVSTQIFQDKFYCQITKGGIEEILETISHVKTNGEIKKINIDDFESIKTKANFYSNQGYRLVGLGYKKSQSIFKIEEKNLIFLGFLIFTDTIKDGVGEVVELIYKNNVDLKILTGDSVSNSLRVAQTVGLRESKAISGKELEKLNNEELQAIASNYNVFCKLTPFQKAEIIKTLQDKNHCVGFLGDGVNDSIALKQSDVGISVNTASSIAKASADAIMLEKDLLVLEKAFLQGRHIFTNAIKYIKISVTNNFSFMLTLIIALLWFDFQPMLPLHLLMQNLLYDFTNLIFVWDNVDKQAIIKPKQWSTKSILPFAAFNAIAATIISVINFAIIGYGFGLVARIQGGDTNALQMFQAAFFLESFLTHMMISIIYRTDRISIFQSNVNWIILVIISSFAVIVFGMVFIPNLNNRLGFQSPPIIWISVLPALIITTWFLGEGNKLFYQKIFKSWI
ncbi:HAD-IC family P-type ATPase [Spiroplasma alleghenense]|uniref:Mg(2+) transport ATPase, P-type n=1 Tax=Spiroplasma alleghenense TaxID=216931 RepID=A0A345Z3P7_9MOLU|nr:HAD-IC family P-type ATPase [Spiroplasma alleghenense]AXK51226.1 Mg(2+) transport ATPase, P-type [Spiroplasma alleghenense]